MADRMRVRGARQHNLKGVDLDIERGVVTVFTGPSGSGKSSLAFDTIYAEGQRRYIESLSTYAKQFLERMPKPAVDSVEGVSPSVAIDQRNAIQSSRSTVGTITEVYDYMRLLWARVGTTVCPDCDEPVIPDTVTSATDEILSLAEGTRIAVVFPLVLSDRISESIAAANLVSQGYLRAIADGEELYLPDRPGGDAGAADGDGTATPTDSGDAAAESGERDDDTGPLTDARELFVVVDRLTVATEIRERLADAIAAAFAEGRGTAVVLEYAKGGGGAQGNGRAHGGAPTRHTFVETHRCASCGREFAEPVPNLFSFNSPAGACPECTGFGANLEYAESLMVPDVECSLRDGALDPWEKPRYSKERRALADYAEAAGIDPGAPWRTLPEAAQRTLLDGGEYGGVRFKGLVPFMRSRERKRYKAYIRVFLRQYQLPQVCHVCGGTRLKPEALAVRIRGEHIAEVSARSIDEIYAWAQGDLGLTPFGRKVAGTILQELLDRLQFLCDVGLGYLTLDRQARTLSGGEMQRIRLASCLGSHLVDTLYVLDEPTIGLHPSDIEAFIGVLERLAERGNTVLIVEHEPVVLERADRIVELGPGAGEGGGEVVFEGDWEALLRAPTGTGEALAARERGEQGFGAARRPRHQGRGRRGRTRRPASGRLTLNGATLHNVHGVDVSLPLGALTAVTGVSGSGKSTLIRGVLFHALEHALEDGSSAKRHLGEEEGSFDALSGAEALDGVILVDQQPIGRTPRSNPATYIRAFKYLREFYASLPEARKRGYEPGYFSFNRPGGRCERCSGAGEETVEMVFLADVSVPCEVCGGSRYKPEVLEIEHRGRSIRDALDMTVDEAIRFFLHQDKLGETLWQLQRVGLGYLRLGQPATTLSGGEAQRLKIARELARGGRGGPRIYILDEPTVGLGVGEVQTLVSVLRELVSEGHTVVVIEHNLDVVAGADHVIDMGPGAADDGGRIVASGTPAEIARADGSKTGAFLRDLFARADGPGADPVPAGSGAAGG